MRDVQQFIEEPNLDLAIFKIFNDSMFSELVDEMRVQNISGLEELQRFWASDYRERLAIREFLKDKSIGTKRLASMPDRITNTINLQAGGSCLRPSVMNAYAGGSMASLALWWPQWKDFMFHTHVQTFSGGSESAEPPQLIFKLVPPILRGKYPAVTENEQAISVPLQIMCLAILDAIFVHILNSVAPLTWEGIRGQICRSLIAGKVPRVCRIIAESYSDCEVMFIQEAAAIFVQDAREHAALRSRYFVLAPKVLDGKRDQNSLILVSRTRFKEEGWADISQQVLDDLGGSWVAPGDLLVVCVEECSGGRRWLLACFHGDSNGLSTQPLVQAICDVASRCYEDHVLLLGIDANTHSASHDAYHQSVASFADFLRSQQLVSLWGDAPDPGAWTACSSRTFIQTQLNKAVAYRDRFTGSQRSLKDWILASERHVERVGGAARDNTGGRAFVDGTVLPTLNFPSDHAIVSAMVVLWERPRPLCPALGLQEAKLSLLSVLSSGRRSNNRDRAATLYDYWGIGEKPMAFRALKAPDDPPDAVPAAEAAVVPLAETL
jgi:hypothetical protein